MPGHEQQCRRADELVGVEVGVEQVRHQVVAGVGPAVRGEAAQCLDELGGRPLGRGAADPSGVGLVHRHDGVRPAAQRGALRLGHGEELGDHLDGQRGRHPRHEVGAAVVGDPLDERAHQPVGQPAHGRLEPGGVPAVERACHQGAQAGVRRPLALEQRVAVQQVERREGRGGFGVHPDAAEVAAAQHVGARGVGDGHGHAEQRVVMDGARGPQRGERRVRVGQEAGVTGVEGGQGVLHACRMPAGGRARPILHGGTR